MALGILHVTSLFKSNFFSEIYIWIEKVFKLIRIVRRIPIVWPFILTTST